ncbi:non-ribosomal peptide synthetase [Algoriphagus algorifonticola]|uniref:non-ribosomal peptide synthetase n=1 Tax=Algoriphagus algorifonticola TaxID=2593007 RepID=UPI0011A34EAB|nr:non-ribosomal peptide synthetase [Algoriphagus algorifonticola]
MLSEIIQISESFPVKVAIKSESETINYSTLVRKAKSIASLIQSIGIQRQCIGISLNEKSDSIIACLGVLLSNNYFFFIPPDPENKWVDHVPVKLLISDSLQENFKCPRLRFPEFFESRPGKLNSWWKNTDLKEQLFCVYATSGSTGSAKFVVHDYQSIIEDTLRQQEENHISESDTLDFVFAPSFSSSLASIFPALISGASIAVYSLNDKSLDKIPEFWRKNQVSFATLTCSAFRTLCKIQKFELSDYTKSIRFLCLSGEPVLANDFQLFCKNFPSSCILQLAYASTETRTISQHKIQSRSSFQIHDGFPVRNKQVKIINAQGLNCKPLEEGEVVIYSPYISLGYFINKEIQAHSKSGQNRIYKTGDRGFISEGQYLVLTGRVNSLQKINGKWVDLELLESEIQQAVHAISCKIITRTDMYGNKYVIACLEMNKIEPEEKLLNKLTKIKDLDIWPRSYLQVSNFPLNFNGKVDTDSLLQMSQEKEFDFVNSKLKDPLVKTIHKIWSTHLGITITNLEADFFKDLGGSSLQSVLIVDELEIALNQKIEDEAIFQYRSILKLANYLNSNVSQKFPHIHWIHSDYDPKKPSIFLIETGLYYSYNVLLKNNFLKNQVNLAYLRVDQFKILNGFKEEFILEELTEILRPYKNPILIATSFNGFVASKILEKLNDGAGIFFDTPWYHIGNKNQIPLINRINPIIHQFKSLPFREASSKVWKLALQFGSKKVQFEKAPISPFEKSIHEFLAQTKPLKMIPNLLYFYSTASVMTSRESVANWKNICRDKFDLVKIQGDHLDGLSEKYSDLVVSHISEFVDEYSKRKVSLK